MALPKPQLRLLSTLDFNGEQQAEYASLIKYLDIDSGFSCGFESLFPVVPWLELGIGADYQFPREVSDYTNYKFNYIPVYSILKVNFLTGQIEPYAIGRLGYNLSFGNDNYTEDATLNGGLYVTVGAGLDYSILRKTTGESEFSVFVEGAYTVDNGSILYDYDLENDEDYKIAINYNRFSILAGIAYHM